MSTQNFQQVVHTLDTITATSATNGAAQSQSASLKTSFVFKRTNHTSGSSAFSVEVSVDGSTWITYNKLISNVTNTNAQNLTRVASVSLSSNTSAFVTMDFQDTFPYIRVSVTNTTDGTADAWIIFQY